MKFDCPKCGHTANVELTSKLEADNMVWFRLTPKHGSLMTAKTVGGTLSALEGLLAQVGKDHGVKTDVLVDGVTVENGEITFCLKVMNHSRGGKLVDD